MLYIEYNFHRWLADVGPTLARRSKSRWPSVGSRRRTDGCANVGPTSVRRWNAIWVVEDSNSNSIFIAPNLQLKTDSRCTKQKQQKTIIIDLRHCKRQRHREKPGKVEVRVDMLVQKSKLGFYVPFNSQGHIGTCTGPQNCHLWDSNPQR